LFNGAQAVVERWCDDGREWRWHELNAGAEEGKRELKSEGRRCGFLRGCTVTPTFCKNKILSN
jgi:hypothetical protein